MPKLSPKDRALGWLARREYGFDELVQRLIKDAEQSPEEAEVLVQQLADANLQSDTRFVESFIRSRIFKGQGPRKIRAELSQRRVDAAMIQMGLEEADVDWLELARDRLERKFGQAPAEDIKEKAKRVRYLAGLGFDESMIYSLVN